MQALPGFDIRYTYVTDDSFLREWLAVEEVQRWFPFSTEKEVEDAVQCWIGYCRYSCSLTGVLNGTPCGIGTLFLMPYRKVSHHCLFKIVVDPKHQKKGIGSSLLKNLKHLAKEYFKLELIHIEVFEGNPLISLLKKQGFQEFARQEEYVRDKGTYLTRILYESYL